ncbi:MAG: SDR family NAD(P)-dependent oxidoreductase [Pseudomonadota bacterium]|nr:SDR family NAD(P)-dependent oxidoreductase [Pseudomonadota bacterium]|tara:strand:+ start:277 stop:993 length:717 start_codon:yes stop_codon:yes gene_type:complete
MKKAIIVGASSGIGEEMAKQLSEKGYQLGLMARRIELLNTLNDELGGKHVVKQIDLQNFDDAENKMKTMISELKDVEIIILNSGIGTQEYQLDWKYQKQVIDVNVSGLVLMSTVAMDYFINRERGQIVGISSVAAHISSGLALTYCASKAFVSSYLNGLRSRARRSKLPITITTIEPGYVDTPMVKSEMPWMAPVGKAVSQMVKGIENLEQHIYITKRVRWVVWFIKITPNWLIRRFI